MVCEVLVVSNKKHCNENEKTSPYDRHNIFFFGGKRNFFISSHFVERNPTYYWFRTKSNNDFMALQTKFKHDLE